MWPPGCCARFGFPEPRKGRKMVAHGVSRGNSVRGESHVLFAVSPGRGVGNVAPAVLTLLRGFNSNGKTWMLGALRTHGSRRGLPSVAPAGAEKTKQRCILESLDKTKNTGGESMAHYATALVCPAAHLITGNIDANPEKRSPFCPTCGKPTTSECGSCKTPIRGNHFFDVESPFGRYREQETTCSHVASHCHQCGKPYPWTEEATNECFMLADEIRGWSNEDSEEFKDVLPALIQEGVKTPRAILVFQRLLSKAMPGAKGILENAIGSLMCEVAKRGMGGGP